MRLHDPATGKIPDWIRLKEIAFAKTLPKREEVVSNGAQLLKKSGIQTPTWELRGPLNYGGRTRALAIDVTDPNVLLAGSVSGGVWRSSDGGNSWARTNTPDQSFGVTCIAQDPRFGKTNIWYYGTGEISNNSQEIAGSNQSSTAGNGMFKSTDGGMSWSQLPSTNVITSVPNCCSGQFQRIASIVIDSVHGAIYSVTASAIMKSTNEGATWTQVFGPNGFSWQRPGADIAVTSEGVLYAGLNYGTPPGGGLWRSVDGNNWTDITPANWPSQVSRVIIGVAPSNEHVAYFLASTLQTGEKAHALWKYTYVSGTGADSGGTWDNLSGNIAPFDSYTGTNLILRVKPDNENVVFVGGIDLYRSTDGFKSSSNTTRIGGWLYRTVYNNNSIWQTEDSHHADQHAIVFSPIDSKTMITANDGGLYKTTDNLAQNVSWTALNNGYITTQFYTVALDHATPGSTTLITGLQDQGSMLINSQTGMARRINEGDGGPSAIADGGTTYYTSIQDGWVYRSTHDNEGVLKTFTRIDPAGARSSFAYNYLLFAPFALDPNNMNRMYFAHRFMLWRHNNLLEIPLSSHSPASAGWDSLKHTLTPSGTVQGSITAIGVSQVPPNRVYYGVYWGVQIRSVYRLDNAHEGNPIPIDVSPLPAIPSLSYVSCIAVDPTDADKVIVCYSNYSIQSLYYTTDGGTSWSAVGGNLEQNISGSGYGPSTRWVSILPREHDTVYFVATSAGLFSTTELNGMSTVWVQEGASTIGNVVVDMVDVRVSDRYVVAASHGNGIYTSFYPPSAVDPLSLVADHSTIPQQYDLKQNYPNPFNPSTTIEFSIPDYSNVTLTIWNELGQHVTTLVQQQLTPGTYKAQWNAKGMASGTYFYRLQTNEFTKTRKLLLLK